jgi:hypothetical protein
MALAEKAADAKEPWLRRMGSPRGRAQQGVGGFTRSGPVAAYGDRYRVDGRGAIGEPHSDAQRLDAARAEQAICRARAIAEEAAATPDGRSRAKSRGWRAIG